MAQQRGLALKEHKVHLTFGNNYVSIRVFEDVDSGKFYIPSFKEQPPRGVSETEVTQRILEAIIKREQIESFNSLKEAVNRARRGEYVPRRD